MCKKSLFISILLFSILVSNAKAQTSDSSWVYTVDYNIVNQTADTSLYNTGVYINLNKLVVRDSSQIIVKLGYIEGHDELYHKEYLFAPSIYNNSEVTLRDNYLRFYLGQYIMPFNHYPASLEILVK